MRVELNATGRGSRMGASIPVEAVAEQMGRVDQTSKAIMVGLTELKGAIYELLGVNRQILTQITENTGQLSRIAEQMTEAVARLGELVAASEALHVELSDTHLDLRENSEEMRRGAIRG